MRFLNGKGLAERTHNLNLTDRQEVKIPDIRKERRPKVEEAVKKFPTPGRNARDALFSRPRTKKLRVGLVGCGRISAKHIAVLQDLSNQADLVAICDIDAARLQKAAQETGARAYSSHRAMLAQEPLDVVGILTWSGNHAEIARECAGVVRNIVVEKPMALRLRDADSLIEACQRSRTRLFVVKQNRYNPPVVALKKALDAGRFGRLILGTVRIRWSRSPEYYRQDPWRGTWAMDGGVLTNQASHHIDLLTWFFGQVESVFAKTGTFLAPIEAEDTGVVLVKFKSGALGIIEATTCARPKDLEASISVLGEKGTVEIGGFAVNEMKTWQFTDQQPGDHAMLDCSSSPPDVYGFGHLQFMKDVIRCIREHRHSMIDGGEGRRSLEVISAIYESVERRQEVVVSFTPQQCRLGEEANAWRNRPWQPLMESRPGHYERNPVS
jgi:predicted dehydrogenase